MKKLFLINAGLLALAMTACQSEEPIGSEQPGNGSTTTVPTDGQFIAINLSDAANAKSRADFAFENGSTDENAIDFTKLRFFFYNSDGTPFMMTGQNINSNDIASNMIKPMFVSGDKDKIEIVPNQTTSDKTKAILVLGKEVGQGYEDGAMPARVLCVANVDPQILETEFAGKTMQEVEGKDFQSIFEDKDGTTTNFVMTSSTYWSNGKKYWADITGVNICSDPKSAQANPVHIYIERLAARVDVTSFPKDNYIYDSKTGEKFVLTYVKWDGTKPVTVTGKYVKASVRGWNVNTLSKKSYAIKQIVDFSKSGTDDYFFKTTAEWSEGVRSFWSKTVTGTTSSTAPVPERFVADNYFTLQANGQVYIPANTGDPFLQGNKISGEGAMRGKVNFARTYATKILVGVDLSIVNEDGTGEEPFNLMYWAGSYYTPEALCHAIADWDESITVPVGFARNGADTNDYIDGKNNANYNVSFYKLAKGAEWGTMLKEDINPANRLGIDPAQYWNGMGYYIINISNDMLASAVTDDQHPDGKEMYGVMRNTIYSYSLGKFVGLGTPIADPTNLTHVENPAFGETFVAAQLSILQWRTVNHDNITLE